jgi:hypothetical protein
MFYAYALLDDKGAEQYDLHSAAQLAEDMYGDDWATHYGRQLPAVNVKVYSYPSACLVAGHFDCSEEVAQRALEWAFEMGRQQFWEDIQEWAEDCFEWHVKIYNAGRYGGWAVVEGLPDIEDWDAIALGQWRRFAKQCADEIAYLTSADRVLEDIEANRWAEENAEQYNFTDTKEGTVCYADVPRCSHCKGKEVSP